MPNLNHCFSKSKVESSAPSKSTLKETRDHHSRPFLNTTFIKNFNSLYDFTLECTPNSKSFAAAADEEEADLSSSESAAADEAAATPDLATVLASRRFFFSSPGRSNSIIDSSSTSSSIASTSSSSPTANQQDPDALVDGSVAIPTISPDPFLDFRRSMQEMVEARQLMDVRANWDHLHELLMCYLTLNPKSAHKFIVGAFADLLVSLMPPPSPPPPPSDDHRKPESSSRGNKSKISRNFM
ncbi:PREDICTED: transcription repressor OFP12-like [Ipomoea nil]|uniref:transcription repressor OFP12-like n=1 Tax=Ipomoea nil TaxID=35883 RepID=UPI0009010681|nr:PREDICTED: transcription repressor OFP12-like [Ipomoea nil]